MNPETEHKLLIAALAVGTVAVLYVGTLAIGFRPTIIAAVAALAADALTSEDQP